MWIWIGGEGLSASCRLILMSHSHAFSVPGCFKYGANQLYTSMAVPNRSLSEIICIRVCAYILVTAMGGVYFAQSFRLRGYYSRGETII